MLYKVKLNFTTYVCCYVKVRVLLIAKLSSASSCQSQSVHRHGKTRLSVDGFSWNCILGNVS